MILVKFFLLSFFIAFIGGKIIGDHRFGKSFIESDLSEISCSSTDSDLSDCYIYTKSSSNCYVSSYTCSTEYALRCYGKSSVRFDAFSCPSILPI